MHVMHMCNVYNLSEPLPEIIRKCAFGLLLAIYLNYKSNKYTVHADENKA